MHNIPKYFIQLVQKGYLYVSVFIVEEKSLLVLYKKCLSTAFLLSNRVYLHISNEEKVCHKQKLHAKYWRKTSCLANIVPQVTRNSLFRPFN